MDQDTLPFGARRSNPTAPGGGTGGVFGKSAPPPAVATAAKVPSPQQVAIVQRWVAAQDAVRAVMRRQRECLDQHCTLIQGELRSFFALTGSAERREQLRRWRRGLSQVHSDERRAFGLTCRDSGMRLAAAEAMERGWIVAVAAPCLLSMAAISEREQRHRLERDEERSRVSLSVSPAVPAALRTGTMDHDEWIERAKIVHMEVIRRWVVRGNLYAAHEDDVRYQHAESRDMIRSREIAARLELCSARLHDYLRSRLLEEERLESLLRGALLGNYTRFATTAHAQLNALRMCVMSDPGGANDEVLQRQRIELWEAEYWFDLIVLFAEETKEVTVVRCGHMERNDRCRIELSEAEVRREIRLAWIAKSLAVVQADDPQYGEIGRRRAIELSEATSIREHVLPLLQRIHCVREEQDRRTMLNYQYHAAIRQIVSSCRESYIGLTLAVDEADKRRSIHRSYMANQIRLVCIASSLRLQSLEGLLRLGLRRREKLIRHALLSALYVFAVECEDRAKLERSAMKAVLRLHRAKQPVADASSPPLLLAGASRGPYVVSPTQRRQHNSQGLTSSVSDSGLMELPGRHVRRWTDSAKRSLRPHGAEMRTVAMVQSDDVTGSPARNCSEQGQQPTTPTRHSSDALRAASWTSARIVVCPLIDDLTFCISPGERLPDHRR